MSPALVESGGEHIVSGIGAAPAAEMAVVRQQQADAILVSSAKGSNLTTVSSQPTATTVVAEGLATPPLPEEPLQGKELLEAIKKQVCHLCACVRCPGSRCKRIRCCLSVQVE